MKIARRVHDLRAEKGVSLPLVAASLLVLMGLAAFAVDLGWFYVNSQRVQRAADAAALAGVVYLPTSEANAYSAAVEVGTNNGYADRPGDQTSGAWPQLVSTKVDPTRLRVQIYDEVPTFFLKVFGKATQVITEHAVAEFVPPLKLGSPGNQFGNACDPRQAGCTGQSNFWANIHGRDTNTSMGDAYSSRCDGGGVSATCPTLNESFGRALTNQPYDGYLYGIEANGAASFTIQFVDIQFRNRSTGNTTGDQIRTGDRGCEDWGNSTNANCGPDVRVTLYAPDETTLNLADATVLCDYTYVPIGQTNNITTASYVWQTPPVPAGCWTRNNPGTGTYVLQVRLVNATGTFDSGLNRYSVRATSLGNAAKLFGLRDMSIYNNFSGSSSNFYLAELSPVYAGKTFVIELYDPGDVALNTDNFIRLIDPTTGAVATTCEVFWKDSESLPWQSLGTHSPCSVNARRANNNDRFQDDWLKMEYRVPDTYTCSGALGCWWSINYAYAGAGSVQDTTTWRAYVIGNPIHLIRG